MVNTNSSSFKDSNSGPETRLRCSVYLPERSAKCVAMVTSCYAFANFPSSRALGSDGDPDITCQHRGMLMNDTL